MSAAFHQPASSASCSDLLPTVLHEKHIIQGMNAKGNTNSSLVVHCCDTWKCQSSSFNHRFSSKRKRLLSSPSVQWS